MSDSSQPSAFPPKPSLSPAQRTRVLEEMRAILSSEAFSNSKRGQRFLKHIVEHSLNSIGEALRERSIGVDLFGRSPSYDTGEDSVVRVTAGDVRHRLKRYQELVGHTRPVEINLPLGSYLPEYCFPPELEPRRRRGQLWISLAVLAALIACGAAAYYFLLARARVIDRFWAPIKSNPAPVMICTANVQRHFLPRSEEPMGPGRRTGQVVPVEEISGTSVVDAVDAGVAVDLTSFLGQMGKTSRARPSSSMSFDDLRGGPTVMIGAFNNQWALERTQELHFTFAHRVGKECSIREQTAPWRHWEIPEEIVASLQPPPRDYGLVSRIFDRDSGQIFVDVGGLTTEGTRAAAECVMSSQCLEAATKNASRDWEHRSLQFVVTTKVVSGTPSAPEVIATYYW